MSLPIGNVAAVQSFRAAMDSGKLHHGWLIAGPLGVGKGSFTRAIATRMLAEAAGEALPPGFDVPEGSRTRALVEAGSHPDLRILERAPRKDKPEELARSIVIDQVRGLLPMFATRPSMSARRVVIIDAVDDVERPGASNALLKSLEEPPAGTIFLLVGHAPGALLPTIRSRCRLLRFHQLDAGEMRVALHRMLPDAPAAEIDALIVAGDGSPGRALALAGLDLAALDRELSTIAAEGDADHTARRRLSKQLGLKTAQERYEAFLDRVPALLARSAREHTGAGLATTLDSYEEAREIARMARANSLDASGTVYELAGIVARLAPRTLQSGGRMR